MTKSDEERQNRGACSFISSPILDLHARVTRHNKTRMPQRREHRATKDHVDLFLWQAAPEANADQGEDGRVDKGHLMSGMWWVGVGG